MSALGLPLYVWIYQCVRLLCIYLVVIVSTRRRFASQIQHLMTREIIWIYWKPAWRGRGLVQVSDQKCIKLPPFFACKRALSAPDFKWWDVSRWMCGRLIAWGSLGAMPDAIFDTDYRVDIIQHNIQTNMEGNYISRSSLNESVCLYACKVEPIVLYIQS